jgi:hypothetical protein
VKDRVGAEPVILVVGPDNLSVRAFHTRADFYRTSEPGAFFLLSDDGSKWDFQGCATDGQAKGICLERVEVIKDYWFDWRHYNPGTTVYGH